MLKKNCKKKYRTHKISLLILILLAFVNTSVISQWASQKTGSNDSYYKDVKFFDRDNGLVASVNGNVFRTEDGGLSWTGKLSGAGTKFFFLNNNTGFVYGSTSIYKTNDQGITWFLFSTDLPLSNVAELVFTSEMIGFAVGGNNSIYKTINGGINWTLLRSGGNDLKSVFFLNNNLGYVGGRYGYKYKTTDGGVNWTYLGSTGGDYINCLFFINENQGWGGCGDIITTINAGISWNLVAVPDMSYVYKVFFKDANNGWAAGANQLVKTIDGGITWTKITTPSSTGRNSLSYIDDKNIWAVGNDQLIVTNTKRVHLSYPNGGELITPNSNFTISFTSFNISNVKLEYSINNGTTWTTITNSVSASSGSYNWMTPNLISSDCKIRISNADDLSVNDQSDNSFTLKGIRIASPNGGEVLTPGSNKNISWTYAGLTNLKIEYSYDNGASWQLISASKEASSLFFTWSIPNSPSNMCKLKISDANSSSFSDQSDNNFIIQGVKINSPNGGENWIIGKQSTISWAFGGVSNVKIDYSTNNGSNWQTIIGSTPANNLSYNWTVPNTLSQNCIVKISDLSNASIIDQSDNVFSIILNKPTLSLPINDAINQPVNIVCKWQSVIGAENYHLQVSNDPNFLSNNLINISSIKDTFKIINELLNKTKYYWRVAAVNASGTSGFSDVRSFTTIVALPSIPILNSPINNSINQQVNNITLNWNPSADVSTYHLQISTDINFKSGIFYNDSTLTNNTKIINGLDNKTNYYWRVFSKNVAGKSQASSTFSFNTIVALPTVPVLISPIDGSINLNIDNINLKWKKSKDFNTYHIQVSPLPDFNSDIILNDSSLTDTTIVLTGLKNNTKYYWRVRAVNIAGKSQYSSIYNFSTIVKKPLPPVLNSPSDGSIDVSANNLTLNWNKSSDASSYQLQISSDLNFLPGKLLIDTTITNNSLIIKRLDNKTIYYWRVLAKNLAGISEYSYIFSFTTIIGIPSIPVLLTPLSGSTNQSLNNLKLIWHKSSAATHYQTQVGTDLNFNNIFFDNADLTDTSCLINNLAGNTKYFWRIRAKNSSFMSAFSNVYYFTTDNSSGINENELYNQVILYPNPTKGLVNLLGLKKDNYKIKVSTLGGQFLKEIGYEKSGYIDLDDIQNGIYILAISHADYVIIKKIVINH